MQIFLNPVSPAVWEGASETYGIIETKKLLIWRILDSCLGELTSKNSRNSRCQAKLGKTPPANNSFVSL